MRTLGFWSLLIPISLSAQTEAQPQVRFTEIHLGNGLDVLLSSDHYAPVCAIAVAYRVGSRDELLGKTGYAHLFEHMMFKGSQNVGPVEHLYLIATNGGVANGTTNEERTLYYDVVPQTQLDMALFLEADRMRSLALTQANLDNQRAAVKEERRSSIDNRPYGPTFEALNTLLFHTFPYQHPVMGSLADLDSASLEDMQDLSERFYSPNNAVLAVVGDVDPADAIQKVRRYFGSIPARVLPKRPDIAEAPPEAEHRIVIRDKFARLARLDLAYPAPPGNTAASRALSLLASVLASDDTSRLYERVVKQEAIASQVAVTANRRSGQGSFIISAVLQPGKTCEQAEATISDEIGKLQSQPIRDAELQRVRNALRRIIALERESAGLRVQQLVDGAILYGDPNWINRDVNLRLAATGPELLDAARSYLHPNARVNACTMPTS